MSTLDPFPDSRDIAMVICIGRIKLTTQWRVVPRIGEIIHGYTLGSKMFSGPVIGIEHHFDADKPEIHVRIPTWSMIK